MNDELEFLLDPKVSLQKNAESYYVLAKECREKQEKIRSMLEKGAAPKKQKQKLVSRKNKSGHMEFFTSGKKQVYAGRNAGQNEVLFSRYSKKGDLLFHADIIGASLVLLKSGEKASEQDQKECFQLSACFSNAWKLGYQVVDCYSFLPEQVEKALAGMYVGKGSFIIMGKKEWQKKTELKLRIGFLDRVLMVVPDCSPTILEKQKILVPGVIEKEEFVKGISEQFSVDPDSIASLLPAGKFSVG